MASANLSSSEARRLGWSLLFFGFVSLALVLVHVVKDEAGNVRFWFGISSLIYSQIFFTLSIAEIGIAVFSIAWPTPKGSVAAYLAIFAGGIWNIAMAAIAYSDEQVRMTLATPQIALIFGILMLITAITGLSAHRATGQSAKRQEKQDLEDRFRRMIKPLIPEGDYVELHRQEQRLKIEKKLPAGFWRTHYERIAASGVQPPPVTPQERKATDELRGVQGIGNLTPSQYAMLELAGYNLDPARFGFDYRNPGAEAVPDLERITIIKRGRSELMTITGQDFGYDLAAWREYLEAHPEHFFDHHYAVKTTRSYLDRAAANPDRERLLAWIDTQESDWNDPEQ